MSTATITPTTTSRSQGGLGLRLALVGAALIVLVVAFWIVGAVIPAPVFAVVGLVLGGGVALGLGLLVLIGLFRAAS